jgi:hypothetical protein
MRTKILAALVVAAVLPITTISARAEHGSCLGDPVCNVTQNAWAGASEADKHTSAYSAVLDAELSEHSPAYWREQEALAGIPPKAPVQSASAQHRRYVK